MVKIFNNYVLSVFIALAFSFSQIVNVNAKYLNNDSHEKEFFVTEQRNENTVNIATFYATSLNYGVENEVPIEGKIEKVLEPVTIGTFGVGMALGYVTSAASMLLGLIIGKIVILIKSAFEN
ncbi:hypothetical protein [Bartonella phoceensis]|uniref:hypothetical protein n=1 Tax=Bartonella phoceensis TaxID=270249 RepID=UPI001ABB4FAC|nr:hypothetical protein [Bartonella phoceensis]